MSRKIYITEAQLKQLMRVKINEEQENINQEEKIINTVRDLINEGEFELVDYNYTATTIGIDGDLWYRVDINDEDYYFLCVEYSSSIDVRGDDGDYYTAPYYTIKLRNFKIKRIIINDSNEKPLVNVNLTQYPNFTEFIYDITYDEIEDNVVSGEYELEEYEPDYDDIDD